MSFAGSKKFKFVLIFLIVLALLAGGFFVYRKNLADADIINDGEFATFSNLSEQEIKTILFDAFISNKDKVKSYTQVRKPLLALYDDLKSGDVNKVPINPVAKRQYWRNYWDSSAKEADSRSFKSFKEKYSMQADPSVAYAATIEERNKHIQTEKLRNEWRKRMVELNLGTRSELTTAWLSLREAIDSGKITSLPDDQELIRLYNQGLLNGKLTESMVANMMPDPVVKAGESVEAAEVAIYKEVDKFMTAVGKYEEPQYKDPYNEWLYGSAYELYLRRGGSPVAISSPSDLDKAGQIITPARNDIRQAAKEEAGEWNEYHGVVQKPENPAEDIVSQISLAMREESERHREMYDDNSYIDDSKPISQLTTEEVKEILLENDPTADYFNGTGNTSPEQEQYQGWPLDSGFNAYVESVQKVAETVEPPFEDPGGDTIKYQDRPSHEELISDAEGILSDSPVDAAINAREAYTAWFDALTAEMPQVGGVSTPKPITKTPGNTVSPVSDEPDDSFTEKANAYADELAQDVFGTMDDGTQLAIEASKDSPIVSDTPTATPSNDSSEDEIKNNQFNGSPAVEVIRKYYGTGKFGINPATGNFEYITTIIHRTGNDEFNIGYITFDPMTKEYTAKVPYTYKGTDITLYSQPRTGDVYLEFAKSDQSPLTTQGKIKLFSTKISKDGAIGGTFAYQNRVFSYNPNTKALEIPIAIAKGGKISPFSTDKASKGMIYLDTKGNVTGSIKLSGDSASKQSGTLFFDRNGSLSYTHEFREVSKNGGVTEIASLSLDAKGNVTGIANVGKLVDLGADFFVSFSDGGITGVNVPIGSAFGQAIGIGIGGDGSISLTSAIPIAGIPLPISLGQDEHGNFGISIPFVGNLVTFGHENRPLWPPQPNLNKDGGLELDHIYSGRHSFKKGFKTVVVYQPPAVEISIEEQKARSKIIFDAYNEYLDRNPSTEEYFNWFIYGGHMPEPMEAAKAENSKLRLAYLKRNLTGEGNAELKVSNVPVRSSTVRSLTRKKAVKHEGQVTSIADHGSFFEDGFCYWCSNGQWRATVSKLSYVSNNQKEFEWIQSGKVAEDFANRPLDIMAFDPYTKLTGQPDNPVDEDGSLRELLNRIEQLAKDDPEIQKIYEDLTGSLERMTQGSATVTATPASTLTSTVTPIESGTVGLPVVQAKVVLSPGYNTLVVGDSSDAVQYLPINTFNEKGLTVFEYQSGEQRRWLRSDKDEIEELVENKGYYVYNPTSSKMEFFEAVRSKQEKDSPHKLDKGWNLLANSSTEGINTKKIDVSLYDGTKSILSDLVVDKKVYSRIYEVKDAQAQKQEDHFEVSTVIQGKTIEPSRIFWAYAW